MSGSFKTIDLSQSECAHKASVKFRHHTAIVQGRKVKYLLRNQPLHSLTSPTEHFCIHYLTWSYKSNIGKIQRIGTQGKEVLSSHFEIMLKLSACLGLIGHILNCSLGCILCKAPTVYGHQILLERTSRRKQL